MKQKFKYLSIICLISLWQDLIAQETSSPGLNIPVADSPSAGNTVPYPGLVNMINYSKFNYVRTIIPDQPVAALPSGAYKYRQSTDYFDGLGRPLQTVIKKGHADGYDVIQPHVYDALGRERYSYLPYVMNNPLATYAGKMRLQVLNELPWFYNQNGPDEQPYSRTDFDDAEMGKVIKQSAPGRSWVGSERGKRTVYLLNQQNEVRNWNIGRNETDLPVTTAFYGPGELSVTQSTDEDGKSVFEYKDKDGLLVLRKNRLVTGVIDMTDHNNFACTYYVYDDQNRLRYVIPPLAVSQINGSWDLSTVPELCFSYFYDYRGRLILKKIPGKEVEEFVYDKRDRVVYSRDGNQKAMGKWGFTLYDGLDRPIMTGLVDHTVSRAVSQNLVDDDLVQYPAPSIWAYVKNFTWLNEYPAQVDGATILTYTYYDNYDQRPAGYEYSDINSYLPSPARPEIEQPFLALDTRGMVTGQKVRVLDPENPNGVQWLHTVNYYDTKGRVLQTKSSDFMGGLVTGSTIYYFQGMPWKTINGYQNALLKPIPNAIDGAVQDYVIESTYSRSLGAGGNDHVWKIDQKINSGPIFNLGNYDYDHLGRVVIKDLRVGLVLNEFNIRGLLTHIGAEDHSILPHKPIFDERIRYDWGFASKLYNGNIAGIIWSGSDAKANAYGYSYDMLDRLLHAEFRFKGASWIKTIKDYTVSKISYDLNGNLKNMWQRGGTSPGLPSDVDKLSYTYQTGTNRLIKVEDAGVNVASYPDFKNNATNAQEYGYDVNGNMIRDDNKGITAIVYNHLNKPSTITTTDGTLYYVYDALGSLLEKRVKPNSGPVSVSDYSGNFIIKDTVLQYILNEEGRARPIANDSTGGYTRFVYDYFIKDHLGNVRSTVTANPITSAYFARHEIATANLEQLVFDNIPNVRDVKPGSINPSDGMAAHLVASDPDKRVGTAILLKVMPGDKFSLSAKTYYEGDYNQTEETGSGPVLESLLSALMGGNTYAGVPVSELPENIQTVQGIFANPALASRVAAVQGIYDVGTAPKAHLNYLFFNDNFELQAEQSGSLQVQPNGTGWGLIDNVNICNCTGTGTVPAGNGFILVYVDNQSLGKDVWFDDIHIEHYTSSVLEENHYYPFGLTVQTMNSGANTTKNDIKFQSQRHDDDLGINIYSFKYREHDPTIGRFWQIDPLAADYVHNSPYAFSENKVTSHFELEGLESMSINNGVNDAISNAWRELKANFQYIADKIDGPSFGDKAKVEVTAGSTTYSTETTTSHHTNMGGRLGYIMRNNTNAGLKTPYFITTVETEKSISTSAEGKIPGVAEVSVSASVNDKNVSTISAEGTVKMKSGLSVGVSASRSSDKSAEVEVSGSGKLGGVSVKASATGSKEDKKAPAVEIGIGAEKEVGNIKYSRSIFIKSN
jgi:RHS repeat-associated protein